MTQAQGTGGTAVTRRKLLIGGALLLSAGAGGGGYALWRWRRFRALPGHSRKLAWYLSARVRWLDLGLDDEVIENWMGEHLRHYGELSRAPRGASDKILRSLLLSTDLYVNGEDAARPITRFVSYYDPHKNPCYNPLRGL